MPQDGKLKGIVQHVSDCKDFPVDSAHIKCWGCSVTAFVTVLRRCRRCKRWAVASKHADAADDDEDAADAAAAGDKDDSCSA